MRRDRISVWVRHKRLIRANLILWPIVLALWEMHFGLLPKITIHPFISGNPFIHEAQSNQPGLSGQAEAVVFPPAATVVPPQLGYDDIRSPKAILETYAYTERIVFDEEQKVFRAATRESPHLSDPGQYPVTMGDSVAVVETVTNDDGRWFRIVILKSTINLAYNGSTGYIQAWLIDGEGIPSPPPTVLPTETATAEPTVEALATETPAPQVEPSSTPDTGILTGSQPVIFNMQTDAGGAIAGGEEGACVDGYVKVHAGPTQATVLFQLGNQYVSADVDQDGHYRKCGLPSGTWGAVVQTLGGNAYRDGNSFQSVVVTEGQVTIASWYEIENPTKTPTF